MARSTEALVEPDILKWARSTAGLSVDEPAHSLQTAPEKVQAWEDGEQHPSMSQLRRMAVAYRRLLSDFYLPRPPEQDPLPHDFRRLPGEVALRYTKVLRTSSGSPGNAGRWRSTSQPSWIPTSRSCRPNCRSTTTLSAWARTCAGCSA